MTQIIDLVDSIEYTSTNCFAHQLYDYLKPLGVKTVPLSDIHRYPNPERVLCRLKQRTVFRKVHELASWAGKAPFVIFDQDPWQAYMDDSEFKGTYEIASQYLNVKKIAVTTQLWADFIQRKGHPSSFVRMGVRPEYCNRGLTYEDRPINAGFIGRLHPYRKTLFDCLDDLDVQVNVQSGSALPYRDFLAALSNIRVFVHSEDGPIIVDGEQMNLSDGLWIKDVEAASQGCFSIRNEGAGYLSYFEGFPKGPDGLGLVRLYKDPDNVPRILEGIERMDPAERQSLIDRTVEYIKGSDRWQETATTLVSEAT